MRRLSVSPDQLEQAWALMARGAPAAFAVNEQHLSSRRFRRFLSRRSRSGLGVEPARANAAICRGIRNGHALTHQPVRHISELTVKSPSDRVTTWVLPIYKRDYAGRMAVDRRVTCGFSLTPAQSIRCFPKQSGGRSDSKPSAKWNLRWRTVRQSSAVFPSAGLKSVARQPPHQSC